ncbi:MAG: toll/interleukin-1 receptor domain-containing protein [Paludibacter sp.]|nr:toll/interleukin-1 receptor domain-containing protein [Paludibacter sp.]
MGKTKRIYNNECVLFKRKFKKPIQNVGAVMPIGFENVDFVSEFKSLFSNLWDDLCSKYQEYNRMDEGLAKKGFPKRYFFPQPNEFIISLINQNVKSLRNKHEYGIILNPDKRNQLREQLLRECENRVNKRKQVQKDNLLFVQKTTPEYTNYFIKAYFECKRCNPQDVDRRYAVIKEASLYKSPQTIKFLHKVNASERNYHLRHLAFLTLQKFGIKEVRLRKNRKGKKRAGDLIVPQQINTPDALINFIYNSQLEQMKTYDLFLSHSSIDKEELLKLKSSLNSEDLNVYIDWVNDRDALSRELTNVDTAKVIIERLKSSNALMYIHSSSSFNSKWAPWELGYFHALEKKVCVFILDFDVDKPPYLDIYPKAYLVEGVIYVNDNGSAIRLSDWLNK